LYGRLLVTNNSIYKQKGGYMQKTIYVKNQAEWDEVKRRASDAGQTVSRYLLGNFQLDRIESKLDLLIPKGMPKSLFEGRFSDKVGVPSDAIDEYENDRRIDPPVREKGGLTPEEISKLKAAQEGAKKKVPGAIKTVKEAEKWAGGFSKDRQLGKKGAK